MINVIEQHRPRIAALCRKYGLRRLDLFGSAASGSFDPKSSDIDFFYEFDPADQNRLADRFFDFQRELESLLGVKVDLVSANDATNPYFLQVANQHRLTLYAA
jgi:predicted nucleotidyltransferase